MIFEFDPKKSSTNKQKHGIDFIEAQRLWDDERLLAYPARTVDEERFIAVGLINGKHWSAIYTTRDKNIRIISVRRSRKEEVNSYES